MITDIAAYNEQKQWDRMVALNKAAINRASIDPEYRQKLLISPPMDLMPAARAVKQAVAAMHFTDSPTP